jgi:hypothetical protein
MGLFALSFCLHTSCQVVKRREAFPPSKIDIVMLEVKDRCRLNGSRNEQISGVMDRN